MKIALTALMLATMLVGYAETRPEPDPPCPWWFCQPGPILVPKTVTQPTTQPSSPAKPVVKTR
jgi:hypothetical protein